MRPQNVSEVQKSIRLGFLITFHATLKDYVACDNTFEHIRFSAVGTHFKPTRPGLANGG